MIIDGDVYPSIHAMAIDWLHGNIYFVNIDFHTIHICRLDGRFCRVLFQPSIIDYHPFHLIVDPEKGFVDLLHLDARSTTTDMLIRLVFSSLHRFSNLELNRFSVCRSMENNFDFSPL